MKRADPFPALLRAFFYEWMVEQRNASAHTVRSYRDTWRLFLRFVAARRRRTVAQLTLGELTGFEVSAFLQYTEQERHDSIGWPGGSQQRRRSAPKSCAFQPKRRRCTPRLTWT